MISKRYEWRIVIRVLLLFIALCAASYLLVNRLYMYFALVIPVIIFQLIDFYRFNKKGQQEVEQFVESVHYRDF